MLRRELGFRDVLRIEYDSGVFRVSECKAIKICTGNPLIYTRSDSSSYLARAERALFLSKSLPNLCHVRDDQRMITVLPIGCRVKVNLSVSATANQKVSIMKEDKIGGSARERLMAQQSDSNEA